MIHWSTLHLHLLVVNHVARVLVVSLGYGLDFGRAVPFDLVGELLTASVLGKHVGSLWVLVGWDP